MVGQIITIVIKGGFKVMVAEVIDSVLGYMV